VFIVERGNLRPTLDDFLSQPCSIHKDAKHTNGECRELMKAFGAAPAAKKPRAVDRPRSNGGRVNYQRRNGDNRRQEYRRRDDNRDDHHDNDRHNNNRHQDDDTRGNRQGHGDNDRHRRDDDEAQALPPPLRDLPDGYQQVGHEVNIIIGGPNAFRPRREKKVISRVVHAIYTKPVEFLRWSETPILFSRDDHRVHLPDPGSYPLVVAPTVNKVKLTKVLVDGGATLNIIFTNTLRDMGCNLSKLVPCDNPFYGVIPGSASYPIGRVTFPVTFGKPDNFRTEYLTFEVAGFNSSYHAIRQTHARQVNGNSKPHLSGDEDACATRHSLHLR
jgi:hypothetical protein